MAPWTFSLPGSSIHGDSPGKNTGLGCHTLRQGIVPTQGSNPDLPHYRQILYHLSHQGSPRILEWVIFPFSRWSSNREIKPRSALQVASLPACISTQTLTSLLPVHAQSVSHVQLFEIPWNIASLASMYMEFSRQEYWSELPFLLQRIFLTLGSNPHLSVSCIHRGIVYHWATVVLR